MPVPKLVERLDDRWYPGIDGNWDDTLFRERILQLIDRDKDLLDVGAGAGIVEQMNFRGLARRVSGVDPDPRVLENPFLDDAKVGSAESLPFEANSFDIVVSDNVLEHLSDPGGVFSEVARVLRPGGRFLFKTPNVYHYMPTIARITPHKFHQFVNKLRGRETDDTFPTLYRANSESDLKRLADEVGFVVHSIEHIEGRPEYMRFSPPTYLVGYFYERLVNSAAFFEKLRILLIGEFELRA